MIFIWNSNGLDCDCSKRKGEISNVFKENPKSAPGKVS